MTNRTGIVGYSVGYSVDADGGGQGLTRPDNVTEYNSTVQQATITIVDDAGNLPDGSTIVVWLSALDAGGTRDDVTFPVGIDRSMATIHNDSFATSDRLDQFSSRYCCTVLRCVVLCSRQLSAILSTRSTDADAV